MEFASIKQHFQDWVTQQWVILSGKKINATEYNWLLGPFGNTTGIGNKLISQLAKDENLEIDKTNRPKGILTSINQLNLSQSELDKLSKEVIDFYENTSNYDLDLIVKWNPFFKIFGILLKILFSNRIEQLNIPMNNNNAFKEMNSNIIQLVDRDSKQLKRTVWLRTFKKTNQVVYSGVYETCQLPSGTTCIKAIFPLPNGSATVILQPSVGNDGSLILQSSGKKIGDSGFYFLLKDSKGNLWTKYIKSFKDSLTVISVNGKMKANQVLTFYGVKVLTFQYEINKTPSI